MKPKTKLIIDLAFVVLVVICLVTCFVWCGTGAETAYKPTTAPTKEVAVEQKQEPVVEKVTLYAVPLDEELQLFIIETAEAHGIDPTIIFAMAFYESTYKTDAIGDSGNSLGLLQVQPYWHYARMERLGCTDLLDPYQNVTVAIDYLAEQIDRYGDLTKGVVAYNKGHYAGEVTQYAKNVLYKAVEIANSKYEVEA